VGLSPTVDEGSIKVDGHGKASISGLTVESVRNPEHFQDVYDSDSDDDLDKPEPRRLPDKPMKLQRLEASIRKMQADIAMLDNEIKTAQEGMQGLQQLTGTVGKENISAEEITLRVEKFQDTSRHQAQQIQDAREKKVPLAEELPKLTLDMETAHRAYMRDTKEQRKEMKRAEAKWQRTRKTRQKARRERFTERAKFWPRNIYKITVIVERLADAHSSSSSDPARDKERISLSLCYVTSEASWTPAYDISIESESRSGTLIYRAEISNQTSETWRDAQLTLSTSQTSFTGLRDPLPELVPWHIRLLGGKSNSGSSALISTQERDSRFASSWGRAAPFRRTENFGVPDEENPILTFNPFNGDFGNSPVVQPQPPPPPPPAPAPAMSRSVGGLFGSSPGAPLLDEGYGAPRSSSFFGSIAPGGAPGGGPPLSGAFGGEAPKAKKEARVESADAFKPISIPEAAWEESGLTAVWDLNGQHTIGPSSKRHRHRIAMIDLSDLELKHVCVPKLRTDAFLTLRLRNPSGQTILTGEAGFTLDGAFLGTKELKRIAPGESTTISLGVDETIVVEYAKPAEKRNLTSGLINKDASAGYQRCVTLRHTKSPEDGSARPVEITVRDQIPLPMDERIRLELAKPQGLRAIGDSVRAGEGVKDETTSGGRSTGRGSVSTPGSGRPGGTREEPWGRATASLNKQGKIEWTVYLNPGQKAALPLEYELRFPASDSLTSD
jgi:Domain of unknown function (DUF4139)/N-terminal domain of unknown function (DUF4140)